jgi:Icc-related predicted phosphoesterase
MVSRAIVAALALSVAAGFGTPGQLSVVGGQLPAAGGQLSVVGGQLPKADTRQQATGNRQLSDNRQPTTDNHPEPGAPKHAAELTLATHDNSLRIAVIGDTGIQTNTIAHAVSAAKPFDAIILVGDNFYPCGVKSATDPKWHVIDALTRLDIPIFAILGNHDNCGKPDAQVNADVPNWHMPAREYVIRSSVADFAMLDTTPYAAGKSKAPEKFIREAFRENGAEGDGPQTSSPAPSPATAGDRTGMSALHTWRIVVGHHVVASSGFHSTFPRDQARRMRALLPVLRENKVDLYLCGHDHHEELLDLGPPLIVVSGAGSDPIPMITVRDQTVWPKESHFHEPIAFAAIKITREALKIEFINARGGRIAGPFQYPAQ